MSEHDPCDAQGHNRSACARCRMADALVAETTRYLAVCATFHGRVLQDAEGVYNPWFELEPDRFTCAASWAAAEARRDLTPGSPYVNRSQKDVETTTFPMHGAIVDVTDQYPRVPASRGESS